ncbi:hypothetical protein [Novosphingobium album (ex Liu et al. 2023)]|uniref:HAMP domain-containing histidine kinase n=1 Tax=Novosphingobium album (ex Liu et al. 2023) TaxID=3031130 RepID=A0ABT5WKF2_9SPHN|nr:hypothetical protein [Novosphingobium album (ex Liu et al. 2023)]MDE8650523.1 hypothetical protein [Novosphingobium album (ex Liu et al. 2023)]
MMRGMPGETRDTGQRDGTPMQARRREPIAPAAAPATRSASSAASLAARRGPGGGLALNALALALCALLLGLAAIRVEGAAVIGATAAGALFALRQRLILFLIAAAMLIPLAVLPEARLSIGYWSQMALMVGAALLSPRFAPALLHVPQWAWALVAMLGTASFCLSLAGPAGVGMAAATVFGSLCAACLGAGLARHLAMADARLLAWGEDGLAAVTRDLLLGRITSGMLHDLAQPLNVIAMANGNLGYIVEHLDIDDEARRQLVERIARISTHTEGAAYILGLFRWFGREGNQDESRLSVRSALERAVAATRSNVRHHGVAIELKGDGLDYLVPRRHGALEMMAVAALLSAFGAFIRPEGQKLKGTVLLHAALSPAHVVIRFHCTDEAGAVLAGKKLDHATLWLVEQVAREADGDFRCARTAPRGAAQPARFVIRLARDDI